MKVSKQAKEAQLQQIFRLLLESKTQEEIAHQLNIATKTVQRYTQELDKRHGQAQRQKTEDTLFTECQLFKNRMLHLYKILESKASDLKTSGSEAAKCCEVAANIAIDVLKVEAEGMKVVRELGLTVYGKGNRLLHNIKYNSSNSSNSSRDDYAEEGSRDINDTEPEPQQQSTTTNNDNRKF